MADKKKYVVNFTVSGFCEVEAEDEQAAEKMFGALNDEQKVSCVDTKSLLIDFVEEEEHGAKRMKA